jgi:hypothetical protein
VPKLSQFVFLTAIALAVSLFAQEDDTFLAQFGTTFERGGAVAAQNFVSAELMSGRLHRVASQAYNDGLNNTYFLFSQGRDIEITGTPALLRRIREIYALDYLRGVSRSEEFGKGLAQSGKATVESVAGVVRDPAGTVTRLPKGASRFFGRIGEGVKGGRSKGEDSALAGILGVSRAKSQLAAKLGVSPYTTNEELQQELKAVAEASAGGGLVLDVAKMGVGGGVGIALSAVGINKTLQDTLVNSSPEDLRIINRKKLLALGVNRGQADEFLMHPWYSPWDETVVTDALARIGTNPATFLGEACKALTPEDAFYFQRLAQILALYHDSKTPLRIRIEGGIVTALDRDGTLIVPVSLDYGIWAERTARRAEEFMALAKSRPDIKALTLWTDGQLSERLCSELKSRGIGCRINALGNAGR